MNAYLYKKFPFLPKSDFDYLRPEFKYKVKINPSNIIKPVKVKH